MECGIPNWFWICDGGKDWFCGWIWLWIAWLWVCGWLCDWGWDWDCGGDCDWFWGDWVWDR